MSDPTEHPEPILARLAWRSRRGLLELELLLAPFVRLRLAELSAAELAGYEALLENDDLDLYEWLTGRAAPAPAHAATVASIREFLADAPKPPR